VLFNLLIYDYMQAKQTKIENILPHVVFGFNKEWEAFNWYETCVKEATYGLKGGSKKWDLGDIPPEVLTIINQHEYKQDILAAIRLLLKKFIQNPEHSQAIQQTIEKAQKRWDKINGQYFLLLSRMLNVPISEFEKEYYAFFTFGMRCPFHKNTFMFSRFNDFSNTVTHEIMHIEFLKKYTDHCRAKGLSEMQISHLKEILTVLLNEDMKKLLYHSDYGYEKHIAIRKKILKLYQQNKKNKKQFINFLDKAIELMRLQKFT